MQEKCVFQIFQIQMLTKTGKIGENIEWSHVPSECGETKFLLQWSQITWGGELIDLVQLLRLLSYLVFTRFAYASYLPYLYDRTVSTVYQTHFGLCRYLDT